jgi:hypothetical protein
MKEGSLSYSRATAPLRSRLGLAHFRAATVRERLQGV